MTSEILESTGMIASEDKTENLYLNFKVEDQTYGIEIKYVLQIIKMQKITKIPEMPPEMKGFINLRGKMIPVISMRLRFGKVEDSYTNRTCIVVVLVNEKEVGLVVDAICETITIEPENISPLPSLTGCDETAYYIMGVAHLEDSCTAILIDVKEMFNEHII